MKIAKWLHRTHFICQHRCFRHYSNLIFVTFSVIARDSEWDILNLNHILLKKIITKEHIHITINRGQQPALQYYAPIFAPACDNHRVQYKAMWDRSQSYGTCVCRKIACMLAYERSGVIVRVDAGSGKSADDLTAVIKIWIYIIFIYIIFILPNTFSEMYCQTL